MRFLTALLFPADDNYKRALLRFLGIGVFFHLMAVIFSDGYHRTDEYHSIANFLFYKLGAIPESDLININWEYSSAIRSFLQPGFYYLFLKPLYTLGLKDPFYILAIARLLSAILSLVAVTLFILKTKDFFNDLKWQKIYMLLSYTIWFFPFFHVRTTAENFGLSTLIFGLLFFLEKRLIWIGAFFLTLSVALRTPTAPTVLAIYLWYFLTEKNLKKNFRQIIIGTSIAVILTISVDSWGYGHITFSVFNYVWAEFTQSISKGYGIDPWWRYLELTFSRGIPPLSIIFILSFFYFWVKKPLHLFSVVTFSFFALHSATAHKELRFIFGLSGFLPFFITFMLSDLQKHLMNRWWIISGKVLLLINLILMAGVSLRSPQRQIGFYKAIYESKEEITLVQSTHEISSPLTFLLPRKVDFSRLTDPEKNLAGFIATETLLELKFFIPKKECEPIYIPIPAKILLKISTSKFDKMDFWSLFKCK